MPYLPPRQLKAALLVSEGLTNKEIAVRMGTTENVVKNYLRGVFDTLGMSNRVEVALLIVANEAESREALQRREKTIPREPLS